MNTEGIRIVERSEVGTWRGVIAGLRLGRVHKQCMVLELLCENLANNRRNLALYLRDTELNRLFTSFTQKDADVFSPTINNALASIRELVWEQRLSHSGKRVGFTQGEAELVEPSPLLGFVQELSEVDLDTLAALAVYDYGHRNQALSRPKAWFEEMKSLGVTASSSPIQTLDDLKATHRLLEEATALCGPIWNCKD